MTRREQEIVQLEKQIMELTRRLETLKRLDKKSIDLEEKLVNFSDFPWSFGWQCAAKLCNVVTVFDLIHASPNELLKARGFGKAKLKSVEEWMQKYNLTFVYHS